MISNEKCVCMYECIPASHTIKIASSLVKSSDKDEESSISTNKLPLQPSVLPPHLRYNRANSIFLLARIEMAFRIFKFAAFTDTGGGGGCVGGTADGEAIDETD